MLSKFLLLWAAGDVCETLLSTLCFSYLGNAFLRTCERAGWIGSFCHLFVAGNLTRSIHVWYIYLHLPWNQPSMWVNIPSMDGMGKMNTNQLTDLCKLEDMPLRSKRQLDNSSNTWRTIPWTQQSCSGKIHLYMLGSKKSWAQQNLYPGSPTTIFYESMNHHF